ncbi:MAG: FecR domain-containing protein [Emcibacter sp.]|nr:FecR domain-containing protein [Emcibacter sp.]
MSEHILDDYLLDEATEWFVLMRAEDISEERMAGFIAWISQSVKHQAAYVDIGGFWDGFSEKLEKKSMTFLSDHALQGEKKAAKVNRRWYPTLIAASLAFLIISGLSLKFGPTLWMESHSTRIGELADLVLDDGSHLVLNTNSEVRIDLQDDKRIVYLKQGEVYFDVAKDKARPFFVETEGGLVRVLGTKFNIRRQGDYSDVTVLEGKVGVVDFGKIKDNVTTKNLDATLIVDQKFSLGNKEKENVALPTDSAAVLSWRDRKLVYNGESFKTLITDINRYYDGEIRIGDPVLNDIEIVAILKVEDRTTTLKAIETAFNVSARPISKDIIYLYPNK